MTNSNRLLTKDSKPSKVLIVAFLITAFAGFLDAAYLAVKHYQGKIPPCSILHGCEKVTTSQYAVLFGVPLALIGAIYYLIVVILTIAYFDAKKEKIINVAAGLTIVGFLASAYFVYLQLFAIKAICLYCMASALASTVLFVLGIIILKRGRH